MKRKFNKLAGNIHEYRVVMNEEILSEDAREQHATCVARATDFATLINGWARGSKDKHNGLFDAAVPQGVAPKKSQYDKADRPMIKIFAAPKAMRRIQAEFGNRIEAIVRVGRWNEKGLKAAFHAWQHPRGKKTEAPKAQPAAAQFEGYT